MNILNQLLNKKEVILSTKDEFLEGDAILEKFCTLEDLKRFPVPFMGKGWTTYITTYSCDIPQVGKTHIVVVSDPQKWKMTLTDNPTQELKRQLSALYNWFKDTLATDNELFNKGKLDDEDQLQTHIDTLQEFLKIKRTLERLMLNEYLEKTSWST